MSEDEIIDKINYMINNWHRSVVEINIKWIQGLLDLYNNLKEIEKEHQKINGELREEIKEYKMLFDEGNAREYRKRYIEERRKEEPGLLYPDFDEIYERYYQEKEKNKELEEINFKVNNNLLELAEKIENKIIELEEDLKENNYAEKTTISIKYAVKVLQELLEE